MERASQFSSEFTSVCALAFCSRYSSSIVSLRMKSLWITIGWSIFLASLISVSSILRWYASSMILIHLCSSFGVLKHQMELQEHQKEIMNRLRDSTVWKDMLYYVYIAFGCLISCSSPGEKAVASAENRSSGSVMFSKYFSSLISCGTILLKLLCVALYIRYIISFTCKKIALYGLHESMHQWIEKMER